MYYYLSECVPNVHPVCHKLLKLFKHELTLKSCICILRVEVPDGSYTLVPANMNEGAGGDVHYVAIEQDPDQSPEDCLTVCASEGKPRFYH
jgi:hypothetical protein